MRRLLVFAMFVHLVSLPNGLACPSLTGQPVSTLGDVGEHYPLFLGNKNHHPENLTVVYTKLNPHCRVLPDRAHGFLPTLDFYWLLDATHYKPMAEPLKAGARQRLQFTEPQRPYDSYALTGPKTNFWALIMASATPAAYSRGQNVQASSKNRACEDSDHHPQWPQVAVAVIEAQKCAELQMPKLWEKPLGDSTLDRRAMCCQTPGRP